MQFLSAKIDNFRNYDHIEINFCERLNIFIGDNGQGKTNLLEAIYLLASGESFRNIEDINTYKKNKNLLSSLKGNLDRDQKKYLIQILLGEKKIFKINDKPQQSKFLKAHFPSVIFTPDSLGIIKESSEQRRSLLDQALILKNEKSAQIFLDYRKALKTRSRILKDFKEEKQNYSETIKLLDSIQEIFLRLGTEISSLRIEFINEIENEFNNAIQYILGDQNVDISVDYLISKENHRKSSSDQIYRVLEKRMKELLSAELSTGTSLIGPQRHDINFIFNQKDSRFYCSQGQQRAIILSFKVAQIMNYKKYFGFYPLLLLDDVLSELDLKKQNALISFLHEVNTQVFLTTTDVNLPHLFHLESMKVFKIKEGQIV